MISQFQKKKLLIVGDSAFAEIAYEYFSASGEYDLLGFIVEKKYIKNKFLFGISIIPLEDVEQTFFGVDKIFFYVAIVYSDLNRLRTRLYHKMKSLGYKPASYVSNKANISQSATIGEHCFIFEGNNIQPYVHIQENVVLWSGNHIGHHSIIERNCFISSHVVISGFCSIGKNTFIGVNSTISNNVVIGDDNWIGAASTILQNTPNNSLFRPRQTEASKINSLRFFKVHNEME